MLHPSLLCMHYLRISILLITNSQRTISSPSTNQTAKSYIYSTHPPLCPYFGLYIGWWGTSQELPRTTSRTTPPFPFAAKRFIPQFYFNCINMWRLDILTIQDHNFLNPLCRYTTWENLAAWYHDFQTIGRLTIQWIQTAQRQMLQLGYESRWNWEAQQGAHLEYKSMPGEVNFLSDPTWGSDDGSDVQSNGDLALQSPIFGYLWGGPILWFRVP